MCILIMSMCYKNIMVHICFLNCKSLDHFKVLAVVCSSSVHLHSIIECVAAVSDLLMSVCHQPGAALPTRRALSLRRPRRARAMPAHTAQVNTHTLTYTQENVASVNCTLLCVAGSYLVSGDLVLSRPPFSIFVVV